jgi:hypothetical protein
MVLLLIVIFRELHLINDGPNSLTIQTLCQDFHLNYDVLQYPNKKNDNKLIK